MARRKDPREIRLGVLSAGNSLGYYLSPVVALLWRFMAGGWAFGVQGGKICDETRCRHWAEFEAILAFSFLALVGSTIYAWITQQSIAPP
jgi:hypothetical protein